MTECSALPDLPEPAKWRATGHRQLRRRSPGQGNGHPDREQFQWGPMLYFAYGSNLCEPRLRARVRSARFVAVGWLAGYDLRFHKRGRDGSGKGDAHPTASHVDRLWGGVAALSADDLMRLDEIEGVGSGYDRVDVQVTLAGGETAAAHTYRASAAFVDPDLRPFGWYLDLVVRGARARGLPGPYIDRIAAVESVPDPDPDRKAAHRQSFC